MTLPCIETSRGQCRFFIWYLNPPGIKLFRIPFPRKSERKKIRTQTTTWLYTVQGILPAYTRLGPLHGQVIRYIQPYQPIRGQVITYIQPNQPIRGQVIRYIQPYQPIRGKVIRYIQPYQPIRGQELTMCPPIAEILTWTSLQGFNLLLCLVSIFYVIQLIVFSNRSYCVGGQHFLFVLTRAVEYGILFCYYSLF